MDGTINVMRRAALYVTLGSAVSILFSIALSQFLLGLALALLLVSKERWRFPPIERPLLVFFLLTVVAIAFSANPLAGLVQVRKFFVFGIALAVATTYRRIKPVMWTMAAWAVSPRSLRSVA